MAQEQQITTEVRALLEQAAQARKGGMPAQVLALLRQAQAKAQALKDRIGEAGALRMLGNLYVSLDQPAKALETLQKALVIYQALGNKVYEAATQGSIGTVYLNTGEPQKALASYEHVLRIFQALGDKDGETAALINLGVVYEDTGQPQKALASYLQALPLTRALGDKQYEAATLGNIGNVYKDSGQPQKALEFILQAYAIHQALGDKRDEVTGLNSLGGLYQAAGHPQKALEFHQKALSLSRSLGSKSSEANALSRIGIVYSGTGQPQKALEFYNQALALYQAIGAKSGEAITLNNLGMLSPPEKALGFYNQALALLRTLGDKGREASTLARMARTYNELGQHQKALELYSQALTLQRGLGNKAEEANALLGMGAVYTDLKQPQKALEPYQQALLLNRALGYKSSEARALHQIALVEETLGQPAPAEEHYAQAVALYETLRNNLGGLSESKSTFLASHLATYYRYLLLLLARAQPKAAFEVAQKTKGRTLLDLMASGRVNLNGELTVAERSQEQALQERVSYLNTQMVKEGVRNEVGAKKRYAALQEELKAVESQLQTFTDMLYARHPSLAQKRIAKTATLEEVAKFLPADTALLDYIVVSQDKLVLFVITRGTVQAVTLALAYKSLVSKAAAFRSDCGDPRRDYHPLAKELYQSLLAPAEKHLTGVKRLVVCPDGALWDVPFQALLSGGQFLAQRYELAYAYSATGAQAALAVKAGRKKPTQSLLAVANPDFGSSQRFGDLKSVSGQRPIDAPSRPIDAPSRPIDAPSRPIDAPSRAFDSVSRAGKIVALPGTQREADALKRLIPGTVLMTGKAAQEGKAKLLASQFRYLHFATHGFFNDASPLLSSLVLAAPISPGSSLATPPPNPPLLGVAVSAAGGNGSAAGGNTSAAGGNTSAAGGKTEDGFLTAREIFDLDLSAEMVVLSACNTARGVQRTGDGVVGLTWALFVAGCPTQVVSQWAVDDASTATLMAGFYGNLAKKKLGKGAALRQASLSLMREPKHAHPYYWAPFVLMGDWR